MKYFKEPAQRIGWLFVLATVAGVLGVVVMSSTLGDDNLLSAVQANQSSLIVGHLLIFVMLTAMVGTAVLIAPLAVQEMAMAIWMIAKGFSDVSEHDPALKAPDQLAEPR